MTEKLLLPVPKTGRDRKKYLPFYGKKYVLSNHFPLDRLQFDGISFHSSEQLYFYMKAMHFGDKKTAGKILKTKTAPQAKRFSNAIKGYDDKKWRGVSAEKMYQANLAKFTQFKHLGDALKKTGSMVLVEASPRDLFWGVGYRATDPKAVDPSQWKGKNILGEVLMRVRETISKEEH